MSISELLRSLSDLLVYYEYDSEGLFWQMNAYHLEGSTFEGGPMSCFLASVAMIILHKCT